MITAAIQRAERSSGRGGPRRCRGGAPVRDLRTRSGAALPVVSRGVPQRSAVQGRVHLTARGRRLVLLIVVVMLLGAFATGRSASSRASADAPVATLALGQLTVQPGDTLWSVAHRLAPQRDPRVVVEQVRRLNHLRTVGLQSGQQLLLPVLR